MPDSAAGPARDLHLELIEVLKVLNRGEEEQGSVVGLERDEVLTLLAKTAAGPRGPEAVGRTLELLVANGLASRLADAEYAWDRGRIVGERFAITAEGKRLLVAEIAKVGRV